MRDAFRKAFFEWLASQVEKGVTAYNADEVSPPPMIGPDGGIIIYANQNAPRPALPYMTMYLNNYRTRGRDQGLAVVDGKRQMLGHREFVVSLQSFGKGAFDSLARLGQLLEADTALEALNSTGIVVYEHSSVNDVSIFLEAGSEERASLELSCRAAVTYIDDVGTIETVSGEATIGDRVTPFHGPPENEA